MDDETASRTIGSVETALRILEKIEQDRDVSLTGLADELGISSSTVHHHVSTLEQNGYLDKVDGDYRVGIRFLRFGGVARDHQEIFQIGRSEVHKIARETGETVRLIVEDDDRGITVYQMTGDAVESRNTRLGTEEDLHSTAAGKAFLSHLPRGRIVEIVERHGLEAHTANTITDRDALFEELETVRSNGLAFDRQEQYEGIRCVAAPVVKEDGEVLGAVSVSAPADRRSEEWFETDVAALLTDVIGVIEVNSEYSSWAEF